MFLGFRKAKISNKHKLLFLSRLFLLFYQPLLFVGKCTFSHFMENKQKSNPHPLCNVGEVQLWLIKTNCFTYLLLQIIIKIIIKTFSFKFEHVSFAKLPKNINDKTCYNLFIPLRKGIIKYTKSLIFLLSFIILFYFEKLYSDTT